MAINHIPKQNGAIPFSPSALLFFSNALLISQHPSLFLGFLLLFEL